MVSSTLNPQAITKNRPATPNSFGSFMTGESSLGNNSSLTEASNKIVKFSNPNVSTVPLDTSSLLTNISTNILNQVDNSIKNTTNFIKTDITRDFEEQITNLRSDIYSKLDEIQNNTKYLQKDVIKTTNEIYQQILNQSPTKIQTEILEKIVPQLETRILELTNNTNTNTNQSQVKSETSVSQIQQTIINIQEQTQTAFDNTLKSFSQDYQQKIKGFDDNRPNNVLSKFLDLYQNAIGFVNFFGDRKNINTVEKNLKSLRVMFEESFEVAKVLRQTIVKIVKQLSNLPSASPSAGGLNLDVNVPGGRLKQAGGPNVRNVGRGAGLGAAAGIGLLGLGGVAAAASGMGKAKQYQEGMLASGVEGAPMGQSIPEGFIDTFSSIVDRFTSAIEGLLKGTKSSPGSSGGGGGGGPSPSPRSPGGGGGPSGVTIKDDAQGLSELGLTQEEWNVYKQGIADVEVAGKPNGGYGIMGGAGGRFAGRYQMGDEAFTEASKVLGIPKPSRQEFLSNPQLQEKMYLGYTISNYRYMQSLSPEFRGMTRQQQLATLPMAQLGIGNLTDQLRSGTIARDQWNTPTTKFSTSVERRRVEAGLNPLGQNLNSPSGGKSISPQSQISAAPAQTQMQTRAQAISQPAQKVPQTISLSPTIIDASPPQQEQQQSGGISTPPSSGGGSIEVPMLPTTNPDNFLTMYSRIVYNIVDG